MIKDIGINNDLVYDINRYDFFIIKSLYING